VPFGPVYTWESEDNIIINERTSQEQVFYIEKSFTDHTADIILYQQGKRIGHCLAEYEKNSLIEVWDIVVDEQYQGKGLAELMAKILLRELLFLQKTTKIKFRVITLFKPEEKEIQMRNLGIGIIVYKLGMTCEYDLKEFIMHNNITNIDCLAPTSHLPPAYKFSLNIFPYTLIVVLMNEDTERPLTDYDVYLKLRSQLDVILTFILKHQVIVGNANYYLEYDMIDLFVSRLASNQTDAAMFKSKIQPTR
jgi:GNAT superfamily N-acetyltransferase